MLCERVRGRPHKMISKIFSGHYFFVWVLASGIGFVATPLLAQNETVNAVKPYNMVLQTLVGLLIIVAVIIVAAWLIKHFGLNRFAASKYLHVVAAIPLGTREKAVLVSIGQNYILLGVAPGCVNRLQKFSKDDLDLDSELTDDQALTIPSKFAQKLSGFMGKN